MPAPVPSIHALGRSTMAQQTAPIRSALPQRRFYFDVKWLIIIAIVAFLLVFQVFPLLYMLYKAFFPMLPFHFRHSRASIPTK